MATNRRKQTLNLTKISRKYSDDDDIKYRHIPKETLSVFKEHVKYADPVVAKEVFLGNFLTAGDISHDIVKLYNGKKKHLSLRQANALVNGTEIKQSIPKDSLAKVHLLVSGRPHYRYIRSGVYKKDQTKFGQTKWQTVVSETGYIKFINSIYQRHGINQKIYNKYKNNSKLTLISIIIKLKYKLNAMDGIIRDADRTNHTNVRNLIYGWFDNDNHYDKTPSKITNEYNNFPKSVKWMTGLINHNGINSNAPTN